MVKEQSIRAAITAIREAYVDEDLAEKVAKQLEEFLDSDIGKLRLQCEDVGALIYELNAIALSATHDLHLAFGTVQNYQGVGSGGFIRVSPHYVQISKLDNIESEVARDQYARMIGQLQDPVVFDLRGCSGGSADALYYILCPFFPDGTPLFELHTRFNPPRTFKAASTIDVFPTSNKIGKYNGRIKILVSGATYSGGEIFAKTLQTLQTHGRAKIYGTQTNGAFHPTKHMRFDDIMLYLPYVKLVDSITRKDYENVGVTPDFSPPSPEFISTIFTDVADNMFTAVPTDIKTDQKRSSGVKQYKK